MSQFSFNASEVEPSTGFALIPAGDYIAVITDAELQDNKAGNGRFIKMEFEIVEGEYSGRKLWTNLNVEHPNAEAVKIARAELSAICRAVNVMNLSDTMQLINIPLVETVGSKKVKGSDDVVNVIKKYSAKQSFAPNATPAYSQPGTSEKPPWAR